MLEDLTAFRDGLAAQQEQGKPDFPAFNQTI